MIDADNSPAKYIHSILIKLAGYGTVNIRRAYGNWASPHLGGWQAVIHEHAIQPIQQYEIQPDNSMLKAGHGSFQYSPFQDSVQPQSALNQRIALSTGMNSDGTVL